MLYTDAFFDRAPERKGTDCNKWDGMADRFGVSPDSDLIPMWIADMDFYSPQEVQDTILERAKAGCYGYAMKTDSFYQAILGWISRRYHWEAKKEWIVITPGVHPGLNIAIQSLTKPGDGIIIQTPVYHPFMKEIAVNGRRLVNNRLLEKDGDWFIDFADLEEKVKDPDTTLMIFCSPHNPVGRVWTKEEVVRVAKLCAENDVVLVADELHADLVREGVTHHPVCAAAPEYMDNVITYYAASKTFNLAGLQTAAAVIPGKRIRDRYNKGLNQNRIFNANWFGAAAMETAFTKCDGYVDALNHYLDGNIDYMTEFVNTRLPMLKMKKPEGTYLTWVDFRGTGMSPEEIEKFIIEKAHIATDMGTVFGPGGEGYLRFNLACPRAMVVKAMEQLEQALKKG